MGKPVLGSCFGAQLIADVLGGKVTRNRFKEIGWHRVKAVAEENSNNEGKIISGLPAGLFPEFTAFMWHGDTFEIPEGAVRLFKAKPARTRVSFMGIMSSGCSSTLKPTGSGYVT